MSKCNGLLSNKFVDFYAIYENKLYDGNKLFKLDDSKDSLVLRNDQLKGVQLIVIKSLEEESNSGCNGNWQNYSLNSMQDVIDNFNTKNILYLTIPEDGENPMFVYIWDHNALIHNPYTCS